MRLAACAILLLALLPAAVFRLHAQPVVIYRCTDASGALTVQNDVPCPKGSKQDKRVIEPPPTMPAYRPQAEPAPPARPAPIVAATPAGAAPADANANAPSIADADRLPPPALYQCNTYDNDSYYSEEAVPPPRCVRMPVTGVDGNSDSAAGTACEMVTDQCQRVPDGSACQGWALRLRQAEAAWKFGRADVAATNKAEYERIRKVVVESTCAVTAPVQNP